MTNILILDLESFGVRIKTFLKSPRDSFLGMVILVLNLGLKLEFLIWSFEGPGKDFIEA